MKTVKWQRKKFLQYPQNLCHKQIPNTDYFLDQVAQRYYWKVHFFDESSVIVTAGNRGYGNSYLGEPAIKFQRYASNANYTLNLLHSIHGVNYFDVFRGPSNSMELLNFFSEALLVNRADGTTILELERWYGYHGQLWVSSWTFCRPLITRHFTRAWCWSAVTTCLLVPLKYLWTLFSPNKVLSQTEFILDRQWNWDGNRWRCIKNNCSKFNRIF